MRTSRSLVSIAALVAVTVSGCAAGGSDSGQPEASPPAQTEPAPQSEEPEPAETATTPTASPEAAAPQAEAPAAATITIVDFAFEVPESVAPGTEITVTNEDTTYHTVTADGGAFDIGARQGEPVTFLAPLEPGEYAFHCGPHPEMVAILVVA